MAPSSNQNRSEIGANLDQKLMPLEIDLLKDAIRCWDGKWKQVRTNIDQTSTPVAKIDFLKNRALPAAGAIKMRIGGSKLGAKIDQKSINKGNQHGNASWHRFLK